MKPTQIADRAERRDAGPAPDVDVQRWTIDGRPYVLVSERHYRMLVHALAETTATAHHEEPVGGLEAMLGGAGFSREDVADVLQAPSFGVRLQRLRQGRRFDQSELARLAGVSQTMVSNLENDKVARPSAQAVYRLLESLGVPCAAAYGLMTGPHGADARLAVRRAASIPPGIDRRINKTG